MTSTAIRPLTVVVGGIQWLNAVRLTMGEGKESYGTGATRFSPYSWALPPLVDN